MKKLISIIVFCIVLCAQNAFSYALKEDYVENPNSAQYGIGKVISNQPIKYFIVRHKSKNSNTPLTGTVRDRAAIVEGFGIWFSYAQSQIEKAGRSAEFADIMPILSRGVQLQEVNSEDQADVIFDFMSEAAIAKRCQGTAAAGCAIGNKMIIPHIPAKQGNALSDPEVTIIHELGHYYGLADQLWSAHNHSLVYSIPERFGKKITIMNGTHDNFGCDDVDNIVNLIDFAKANKAKGKWSVRGEKGWKSFCDATMFQEAKVFNRKDYTGKQCIYKFGNNGNINNVLCPDPFVLANRYVSYKKNGLPDVLKDVDHNWLITYTFWKGGTNLTGTVKSADSGKSILALKAERKNNDGSVSWEVPYHESTMNVDVSGSEGCRLYWDQEHGKGSTESHGIVVNNNGSLIPTYYSLSLRPHHKYTGMNQNPLFTNNMAIYLASYLMEKTGVWRCSIFVDHSEREVFVYEDNQLTSSDKNTAKEIASSMGLSVTELEQAGQQACLQQQAVRGVKQAELKSICRLFYRMEDLYQQSGK